MLPAWQDEAEILTVVAGCRCARCRRISGRPSPRSCTCSTPRWRLRTVSRPAPWPGTWKSSWASCCPCSASRRCRCGPEPYTSCTMNAQGSRCKPLNLAVLISNPLPYHSCADYASAADSHSCYACIPTSYLHGDAHVLLLWSEQ